MPGVRIAQQEAHGVDRREAGDPPRVDPMERFGAQALELLDAQRDLVREGADDRLLARIDRVPRRRVPRAAHHRAADGRLEIAVHLEVIDRERRFGVERRDVGVGQAERADHRGDRARLLAVDGTVGGEDRAK